MRTLLLLALFALFAGVGVVALIETDPGYVLIAYGNYTLESSLWVFLVLFALFTGLLYLLLRLLRRLLASNRTLMGWLGGRRARVSQRLTTRGLINVIEGNWIRARRQLLRGAVNNESPLLNYLMAARASFELGEMDKVREYLGAAEDSDAEAGIAVELTQAELKLAGGQYEQALATLVRARRNAGKHPQVLGLLARAYRGLEDWDSLESLLPELSKYGVYDQAQMDALSRELYDHQLQAAAGNVAGLASRWQAVPANLKTDEAMQTAYVEALLSCEAYDEAAKFLQKSLKKQWLSQLARCYGGLQGQRLPKYRAQAEAWLSAHGKDRNLLMALGRLCCREEQWSKAREYFEKAHELEATPEVCAELGRLLSAMGEPRPAGAYFREGLLLAAQLQELPGPAPALQHDEVPRLEQPEGIAQ
ncbi:MAG: heme biosynthesis HemY N-terminal domain-containing protein [Pseudomonadota bacterium]